MFKFEFNQVVLAIYYVDVFISKLKKLSPDLDVTVRLLENAFIIAVILTSKIHSDQIFSHKSMVDYFDLEDLHELESSYYELVDYKLFVSGNIIEKYKEVLF